MSNENYLELNEETIPLIEQICDGMPGGFFIYKSEGDGELIYANKAMLRIFDCKNDKEFRWLTNNTFRGIVHPDDYARVQKSIEEQIADNPYNLDYVEYRIIRADGSVRWVEDYGHYLPESYYGSIFYVFIEDTTDRMRKRMDDLERVNEKLQNVHAREAQYKKAILSNAVTFFEINLTKDEFISSENSSELEDARKFFEFSQDKECRCYSEFVKSWTEAMAPESAAEYADFFNCERLVNCYENGKLEQVFEHAHKTKLGGDQIYQYVFLIGKNEYTGDIIALLVIKDITGTNESNRLFQMALKEANAGKVARETFLNNISHDVRTPLNSIIGFTQLIDSFSGEPEKLKFYLERIKTSSKELLDIVNETLEITDMESGKSAISAADCNLSDIISEVAKTVIPFAGEKNITFTVNRSGVRDYSIVADDSRLKEIFIQLLDNAIKYTPDGGEVTFRISEDEKSPAGFGIYHFEVEDNGIGMGEDFLGSIYEPFRRENNTTMSGVLGSGLGLTVVKNLVDMMNGEIEVESKVRQGTKFTVTLTLALQTLQLLSNEAEQKEFSDDVLNGIKILLVDDNEINLEIEKEMLSSFGCIVETSRNGKDAVERVMNVPESEIYDIILMDLQMPIMNGYDAAKQIRALGERKRSEIAIIAVSANTFESDREKCLEVGMDAHFPKPIDIMALRRLIAKILKLS